MRIWDVFDMCIKNLVKRKLRTLLTLSGIMIGTCSIILMISLGAATDAQFAQMIEDRNLDMTSIQVRQDGMWEWDPETGRAVEIKADNELTDAMVDRIGRIRGVTVATPIMRGGEIYLKSGVYELQAWNVIGVRPEAMAQMGLNVETGRLLQDGDEFAAVFSANTEKYFYDSTERDWWLSHRIYGDGDFDETYVDVLNDPILLYYEYRGLFGGMVSDDDDFGMELEQIFTPSRSFDLQVVGILERVDDMWGGRSGNDTIYMNVDTVQLLNQMRRETERNRARDEVDWWTGASTVSTIPDEIRESYEELLVRVETMDDTKRVADLIKDMGFLVYFEGDWIDQQRQSQQAIETLLSAIAAISLLVAAINIANTMITSVTERTREIGIMKVIGATVSDVRKLFLTEAVVIGLLGGLFGIGLSLFGSYAMNNFNIPFLENLNMGVPEWLLLGDERPKISLVTWELCAMALGVAGVVGVVSGFYPALRATRLSAIAAIRGD